MRNREAFKRQAERDLAIAPRFSAIDPGYNFLAAVQVGRVLVGLPIRFSEPRSAVFLCLPSRNEKTPRCPLLVLLILRA